MKIKAVAFDIDGTLFPSYVMLVRTFLPAVLHPRLIMGFRQMRRDIRNDPLIDKVSHSGNPREFFRQRQAELITQYLNISPEQSADKIDKVLYKHWEQSFRGIRSFRGVPEALSALQSRGFALAALSDFPAEPKLSYLGLSHYFSVAFSSEECGVLKPADVPFLTLAERLNLQPKEILYIGNSFQYDILGAHAAGFYTAHFCTRPPLQTPALFSFKRYRELPALITAACESLCGESIS